jgi:hypothetical protein
MWGCQEDIGEQWGHWLALGRCQGTPNNIQEMLGSMKKMSQNIGNFFLLMTKDNKGTEKTLDNIEKMLNKH